MKLLLALFFSFLMFSACTSERDCPDADLVNSLRCPEEEEPVCGCNGVTYQNECIAQRTGIWVDYKGKCVQ